MSMPGDRVGTLGGGIPPPPLPVTVGTPAVKVRVGLALADGVEVSVAVTVGVRVMTPCGAAGPRPNALEDAKTKTLARTNRLLMDPPSPGSRARRCGHSRSLKRPSLRGAPSSARSEV